MTAASNQDTVFIRDLEVRAIIGIEDWERKKLQPILIDLDMACDARRAAEEDDIAQAVNYRSVAKAAEKLTIDGAFQLVETLAERLAAMVRTEFGVSWVRVRVRKPGAVRFSREVGVEIERGSRGSAA
ncbi:MAG: dihydroneopterin aldolase [Planctomycetota bacterium]|nr:dihydroneopterin aldolase [Planctomycetota bacterium]